MEFFNGINWTLFGVAVAVALSCWVSAVGVGTAGQAAAGVLSEKPALSTKLIIMQLLPGSQLPGSPCFPAYRQVFHCHGHSSDSRM